MKSHALKYYTVCYQLFMHEHAAVVEGVTVMLFSYMRVNVSWNALIHPYIPIDTYTVVYNPVSEKNRKNITAVFPGSVTSGVITDLETAVIYRFQVFATITVDGVPLEGEWSAPVYTASNVH